MKREPQNHPILFHDTLNGEAESGWAVPPRDYLNVSGHGRFCLQDNGTRKKSPPHPAAGDQTWSR
jgi:hypothetical protein